MDSQHFWKSIIHRNIEKFVSEGKILSNLKNQDYELIRKVFEGCGGSWVELSEGKPDSFQLIRKCCKIFLRVRKRKGKRPYDSN